MLMLVCGNIREGKTIFLMYLTWKLHLLNMCVPEKYRLPIYTNFNIKYPEAKRVEVGDLLDLQGIMAGFMPIQELYVWLESRVSGFSMLNQYVSYFIFQSGKRGVDVCGDAQLGSSIDLRFWDLAHIIALVRKDAVNEQFVYQFAVRCGLGVRVTTRNLPFKVASLFWNDYDTGEPAVPLGLKRLQYEMDKFNAEKINVRVDGIVSNLLAGEDNKAFYLVNGVPHRFSDIRKVFRWYDERSVKKYQVEDLLLRLGEPVPLASLVTNRLKCLIETQ